MELFLAWEGGYCCKAFGRNFEKCGEIFSSCGYCSTVCFARGRISLGKHSVYYTGLYLMSYIIPGNYTNPMGRAL